MGILEIILSIRLKESEVEEKAIEQVLQMDGAILGKLLELDSKNGSNENESELYLGCKIVFSAYSNVLDVIRALMIFHSSSSLRRPYVYKVLTNDAAIKAGIAIEGAKLVNNSYAVRVFDEQYAIDNGIALPIARLMSLANADVASEMLCVLGNLSKKKVEPTKIVERIKLLATPDIDNGFKLAYASSIIKNDDAEKAGIILDGAKLILEQNNVSIASAMYSILTNKDTLRYGFAISMAKLVADLKIDDREFLECALRIARYDEKTVSSGLSYEALKALGTAQKPMWKMATDIFTNADCISGGMALEGLKLICKQKNVNIARSMYMILTNKTAIKHEQALSMASLIAKINIDDEEFLNCALAIALLDEEAIKNGEVYEEIKLLGTAKKPMWKFIKCILTNQDCIKAGIALEGAKIFVKTGSVSIATILQNSYVIKSGIALDVARYLSSINRGSDFETYVLYMILYFEKNNIDANVVIEHIKLLELAEDKKKLNFAYGILVNSTMLNYNVEKEAVTLICNMDDSQKVNCAVSILTDAPNGITSLEIAKLIDKMEVSDEKLLDIIYAIATNKELNEAGIVLEAVKLIISVNSMKYMKLMEDIFLNAELVRTGATIQLAQTAIKLDEYEINADNAKRNDMQMILDSAINENIGKMEFDDNDKLIVDKALSYIADYALPKKTIVRVKKIERK